MLRNEKCKCTQTQEVLTKYQYNYDYTFITQCHPYPQSPSDQLNGHFDCFDFKPHLTPGFSCLE